MNIKIIISATLITAVAAFGVIHHLHGSDEHNHHSSSTATLSLNNGMLWQSDDHTRQSMQLINRILSQQGDIDSLDQYNEVGTEVYTELQNLIQGCTMKGPEHDQLHIYLGLLIPKIDSIREGRDLKVAEQDFKEIKELSAMFPTYFL